MKYDPDNYKALYRRAEAYYELKKLTKAREDADLLLAKDSSSKCLLTLSLANCRCCRRAIQRKAQRTGKVLQGKERWSLSWHVQPCKDCKDVRR